MLAINAITPLPRVDKIA